MHHSARLAFCSFMFALALPLHAQSARQAQDAPQAASTDSVQAAAAVASPAVDVRVSGAPENGLRAGVHARDTARPEQPTMAAAHANLGQARAMMIVGAAALVVGGIIGGTPGTIIMIGGGLVGLKGLYDYLQ